MSQPTPGLPLDKSQQKNVRGVTVDRRNNDTQRAVVFALFFDLGLNSVESVFFEVFIGFGTTGGIYEINTSFTSS